MFIENIELLGTFFPKQIASYFDKFAQVIMFLQSLIHLSICLREKCFLNCSKIFGNFKNALFELKLLWLHTFGTSFEKIGLLFIPTFGLYYLELSPTALLHLYYDTLEIQN